MQDIKRVKKVVTVWWIAGMVGMVLTAPVWVPMAVYEKLTSK